MISLAVIASYAVWILFALFWLVAFFVLYHLERFGIGLFPKRLAVVFFAGAVVLFAFAVYFYATLDLAPLNNFTL